VSGERLAADLVGGREVAVLPVARGERAELVQDVDEDVGAVGLETGAAHGMRLDHSPCFQDRGLETRRVGDLHRAAPHHGDRLEVLGPHHRADAGATGGAVHLVHHVGERGQPLTGRADAGDLGVLVGLGAHEIGGVRRVLAPDSAGVADLDRVVLDPQVHRLVRPALNDQGVVAGELELRAEGASGVRRGERVVERPLGDDVEPARRRREGARERPGSEHELVLRRQGVGLRVDLGADDVAAQTAGAQVVARDLRVGGLAGDLARGEVDTQDRARPAEHLSSPPGRRP